MLILVTPWLSVTDAAKATLLSRFGPLYQQPLDGAENGFFSFHFSFINIPEKMKGNLHRCLPHGEER